MPTFTPHYGLTAFTFGDAYLSALDKRRFTIIDTQLYFLASQIGDGIIDGWTLSDAGGLKIDIAPGNGIIDGFATNTFGTLSVQLQDNKRYYAYIKRIDAKSEHSSFSETAIVDYTDVTAPQPPTALTLVDKDYNFIQFSWTLSTDIDVAYYTVYRSPNNITYTKIGESTTDEYTDDTVDFNITYYYKVYAVDNSGLTSVASSVFSTASLNDTRLPSDPINVQIVNGCESLEVVWDASPFLLDHYKITIQPIDTNGVNDGAAIVNTSTNQYWIETGLTNGQFYKVTVQTVSPAGIESSGVSVTGQPVFSYGSKEFASFSIVETVIDDSFNIQLDLSWTISPSALSAPSYYVITVSSGEESVASYYDGVGETASITGFTLVSGIENSIAENTSYTITIESVDTNGIRSTPYIVRHRTGKYSPPAGVTNLFIDAAYTSVNKYVNISWNNSTSEFSYNKITVIKKPAATPSDTGTWVYVTVDENIGNAETYELDASDIENEFLYTANVIAVDSSGNESLESSYTYAIAVTLETTSIVGGVEITGIRPPAPTNITSMSGDDQVTLYWEAADSEYIASYNIWRSLASTLDFVNIGSVDASSPLKFNDYTVENGQQYFYFITSVDVASQESPSPADGFISYIFTPGEPRTHSSLSKPLGLVAYIENTYDITLSWEADADAFDGYAVLRSINSETNFIQIGSVDSYATSFTDTDALTHSGTYRYMIRKYRNNAEAVITTSTTAPIDAIKLGTILIVSGSMTIYPDYYIIKNLLSPITDEFARQMLSPTHLYMSSIDDRRIRFGDTMTIADWVTDDYKIYVTPSDIRNTSAYTIYLDGVQSALSSGIDRENGQITFEQPIYTISDTITAPVLSVVFSDLEEVTGVLPIEHIGDIMANKVTKGKIANENMPQVDHFGRYKEKAAPVQIAMTRSDRYVYEATTPAGISFYDVIKSGDRLIAGSSDGLRISKSDDMSDWDIAITSSYAFTKVFYSSYYQLYFAVAKNEVYYSIDLSEWLATSGISDVNIVRDIIEDNNGNIFASTDAGLFRMNLTSSIRYVWFQIDSNNYNDTFAIHYDTTNSQLIVSKSDELLVSNDAGDTWAILTSNISFPIFSIIQSYTYYFLLSNNTVWRCNTNGSSATEIAILDVKCRKMVVFDDVLFITTNNGLHSSLGNIYTDSIIEFDIAFKQLSRNNNIAPVFGLNLADSRMWLTMDDRIYSVTTNYSLMLHTDTGSICPTLYHNDIETNVGVSYSTSNKVVFDYPITITDSVNIVSSYVDFYLTNGGWASDKYDAEFTLVINDIEQPLASGVAYIPNTASIVASAVEQIVVPFFNGRNSNFAEASKWLQLVVQTQDAISTDALLTPTLIITYDRIALLLYYLDMFKVNLNPELWSSIVMPPLISSTTTASQITYTFNAITGKITIGSGVSKYTNVGANIKNVGLTGTGSLTHKEIEDALESINSGLPLSFANVQQSNIVRLGNSIHKDLPLSDSYQSVFASAEDDWYDVFNSTIDYEEELAMNPTSQNRFGETTYGSFSIEYPTDVLFVESRGEVWVCGYGGIISIDTTTFECKKVIQSDWYFYSMHLNDGIVYSLAEDGLYRIDIADLGYDKDVDISLLEGGTGVLQYGDTTFISTVNGLFAKRPFESSWRTIAEVNNSFLKASDNLTFCIGQDPSDSGTSIVFYTHQGTSWNKSSQFVGYQISGAAQQFSNIYYSSDLGLLVEDVGNLFGTGNIGSTIQPIDLDGDGEPDNFVINAVDADETTVIAARSNGMYYILNGNEVSSSGQSSLQTIHKVKIVNGQYWFFAGNLIEVEGQSRLIQMTTGKALI